jgi:hypothetical protein
MGGSRSVFTGKTKDSKFRVQGLLTPDGMDAFERSRARLSRLVDRDVKLISDADVIEYLARGEMATLRYLGRGK